MAAQEKSLREQLLALVPPEAIRVKVKDEKGGERWRSIKDGFETILETDEILTVYGRPITMKRVPGRKPKPPRPKSTAINPAVAQVQAAKFHHLDKDPLLQMLAKGIDSENILLLVLRGFAGEAASLEFERLEAERHGKETSQISVRRINALKALADSWLKRKDQLAGRTIDMECPAFERLFGFILDTFRTAMTAGGVPRDQAEAVFVRLSEQVSEDTWGEEARNRMQGSR